MARLVHNRTGSVVVVPDGKASGLLLGFGYTVEDATEKAPAKKTAAKKAPAKAAASSKSEK